MIKEVLDGLVIMNDNNKAISPLRYPGSKRRLMSYICNVLSLNNLCPKLYVEPFAGGASVALKLMLEDKVDQIILMDLDPYIAYFWDVVFFDTNWLIKKISSIDVSIEKWHEYKKMMPKSKRDYALACLFLNRTSFSGIIRDEIGPLGGREQKSPYKIDCRFPKTTLIERISRLSK
ncbi:DNA adenine methylase, partial [bacterium]|nr:DNA adenine methylase [bacterium]